MDVILGVGLDSCMIATRHKGINIVQTTDFFYPLVDDPYMQGKIACANVLSDLYAMGVTECDNMLMLLGVSSELTLKEREIVTRLVIQGFNDLAKEAGTTVNGGQTVLNPWYIIGGVASSVVTQDEVIMLVSDANEPFNKVALSCWSFSTRVNLSTYFQKIFGAEKDLLAHILAQKETLSSYSLISSILWCTLVHKIVMLQNIWRRAVLRFTLISDHI